MSSGKSKAARRRRQASETIHPHQPAWPNLEPWTPFVLDPQPTARGGELWMNSRYTVSKLAATVLLDGREVEVVVLGISNADESARHDWREFQRIKNELAGPEAQAVEFYPPESQLLDPSNYFLLWCLPAGSLALPVRPGRHVAAGGPVQRPIEPTA